MRVQIEHRIGVQTPAAEVWRHLADLDAWPSWNPMYPEVSGRLQIGAVLSLTEVVPGEPSEKITATLVDWVPEAQIVWTLKAARGLLRRTRYLEIQPLSEQGCVFSNGEMYEGWAARFLPRRLRRSRRRAFTEVGEALKKRAEVERGQAGRVVAA